MKRVITIVIRKKLILKLLPLAFIISLCLVIMLKFIAEGSFKTVFQGEVSDTNDNLESSGKLAIIVDDFGQNRNGVKDMMSIDRHLTFAVMPFLTFSDSDAVNAHDKGYEVIVHLPLEANAGKISWVGPRPILSSMDEDEIKQIVKDSFDSVPYAAGANIHMGSKAGGDEHVISAIMDVIKEKGLYFVDSRSCKYPIGKKVADAKGVLFHERNIFLDGKQPKSYIISQLRKAGNVALLKGSAVAIGHVGTEGGKITAEAISEMLPEFDSRNIKLVFVSELDTESKKD